jgi:hypothetical protein
MTPQAVAALRAVYSSPRFIADAELDRENVLTLLDEVERLQAVVATLTASLVPEASKR